MKCPDCGHGVNPGPRTKVFDCPTCKAKLAAMPDGKPGVLARFMVYNVLDPLLDSKGLKIFGRFRRTMTLNERHPQVRAQRRAERALLKKRLEQRERNVTVTTKPAWEKGL